MKFPVSIMMKNKTVFFLVPLCFWIGSAYAQEEYFFDDSLLKGWGLRQDQIARYTQSGHFEPGTYEVEVFVNGKHRSRIPVQFLDNPKTGRLEPCFTPEQLVKTLKSKWEDESAQEGATQCLLLEQALPGASYDAQLNKLQLHLSIPMALLLTERLDHVDPSEWDPGETAFFANYDLNWYQSKYRNGFDGSSDYGFAGLNSGFNIGLWRFRHQSTYSYSQFGGRSNNRWNNLRTYVQRSIPSLRSELTVGESFTTGQLFGGMSYRGVNIKSDQRMLPPSQQYYAPEVRGTATTTARVLIRQRGQIIRELTVPPGPFIVDDLQSTSYSGDLDVEIIEADGNVTRYTVPFAAVPQSIRPGLSQYSLTLAQASQYDEPWFAEATYQRGLTNNLTVNLGSRLAKDYVSLLAGGVVAGRMGALGVNFTSSHARVENGTRKNGWRLGADYSQTFDGSNTTLTLAGYRYSSAGYRELSDVLGIRYAEGRYGSWNSYSYQQRAQYSLMLNQNLGRYGSLYFSGSTSDYYQGKQKNTQFQLGYTNSWKSMSYTLSWSYHKNAYYQSYYEFAGAPQISNVQKGNVISLTVSFPLGLSPRAPSLTSTYTSSSGENRGNTLQTGITGAFGENNAYSYAISTSKDSELDGLNWSGNLQRQGPYASMTLGYGQAQDYRQYNVGIRGGLVLHKGGLTLGPLLGDTFALVHAAGAEGAQIHNGQITRINSRGYAVVPALSPYRYNTIRIDPQDLPASTELLETEKRVVPYAGAIVAMSFATRFGQALLIEATQESGQPIPMGAAVSAADDPEIGVVGQGGQIYARVSEKSGNLTVRWGSSDEDSCVLSYDISNADWNQDLVRRKDICRRADAKVQ